MALGQVYEGRAISVSLYLATSYTWVGGRAPGGLKLVYDIQVNGEDWVILGKKKGFYTAIVSASLRFTATELIRDWTTGRSWRD